MHRIPSALRVLALLALAPLAQAADRGVSTGSFRPGETYAPPADHAPAQVSRVHVQTVELHAGRATVDLPMAGGGRLLLWTLPIGPKASRPASTLRTPSGRVLRAGEEGAEGRGLRRFSFRAADLGLELPESQEVIHVDDAEPGVHQLELVGDADTPAVTVVAAEPTSRLTLSTWAAPLSRLPGQPVVLHAELRDARSAVAGAHVTARLAAIGAPAGPAVELFDDGRHGDGAAGDGVYAASLGDLEASTAGFWTARFEAEGRDARGIAFARTGSGGFMNEAGAARLTPGSATARVVGTGDARRLRIEASVEVRVAGDYRLDAIVAGAARRDGTRPGLAWGESSQRLEAGAAHLALEIPMRRIGERRGPLHVDVRLLGLDPKGVAGRADLDLTR